MNTLPQPAAGLRAFLERHCPDPDRLLAALSAEPRLANLRDGERLCTQGDLADCVWVVEDGRLRVEATMAALSTDADAPIPMARKRAVVWFSDVAGFSALSERLRPDEVGSVLRSVIGPQVEEIEAAGGQVDKYMGDGVMAFWLCPDEARLGSDGRPLPPPPQRSEQPHACARSRTTSG